jgi:hypothetical protein
MFKFKVLTLLIVINSIGCSTRPQFKRKTDEKTKVSSIVLTGYNHYAYSKENINSYLKTLEDLNLNTATFLYTCYTDNTSSSNINCNSTRTPRLEDLANAIEQAKTRGFQVSVRHYIDVSSNQWRCLWKPDKIETFFTNYDDFMNYFAVFLEKRKVESFIIGAEYCRITNSDFKEHWTKSIKTIRTNFKGLLSYGANWGESNKRIEYSDVSFWNSLDFIGIDHYMPIPNEYQGIEIQDYQKNQLNKYVQFSKKHNKPIYISEMGFPGYKGARLSPYEWRSSNQSDQKDQADLYRYTLQAIEDTEEIKAIFIWRKLATSPEIMHKYKEQETDYDLHHRKAWYEIKKHFNMH